MSHCRYIMLRDVTCRIVVTLCYIMLRDVTCRIVVTLCYGM